jgi:hypothetical protein
MMSPMPTAGDEHHDAFLLPLTLVPPRRLGELLRAHRDAAGRTIADVAGTSGGRLTVRDVRRLERTGVIPDAGLAAVTAAYDIDPGRLVPTRTAVEIAVDGRWVSADRLEAPWRIDVGDDADPADAVLLRFLALVYALRDREPGNELVLRRADLSALGSRLGGDAEEIAHLADAVARRRPDELRRLTAEARRRLAGDDPHRR